MERSMEFRSQDHHETMSFNQAPPSMRTSAFSKPTLSPSSSLLLSTSRARNGNNCFDLPSSPPPPPPAPAPAMINNPPSNPITSPAPSPTSKTPTTTPPASSSSVKYRECLRNHAASIGGHVVDGCGEFMPDDADAMKCAACGCHRSFHRKESDGGGGGSDSYHRFSNGGVRRRGGSSSHMPLLLPPPPPINPHLQVPGSSATESSSEELNASQQQQYPSAPKKRFRTKFTPEQKEKMLAFSERVGWRIQRQDESMVEQFCAEAGVKRQVLKVWMHNNKNTIRKQLHLEQQQQQPPPQPHQTQQQ